MRGLLRFTVVGALMGCQPVPLALGPSGGSAPNIQINGITEVIDANTLLAPISSAPVVPKFPAGELKVSCGPQSSIYTDPDGLVSFSSGSRNALLVGPSALLCPSGNCRDLPQYRGVGGPRGDFSQDYFVRYAGSKGADPSQGYSNLKINFSPNGLQEVDLSAYRGVIFWARGHGNFAVNLVGRLDKDGLLPLSPDPAYADWNFYLRRFGSELSGDEQWKEVVVYFSDMVQEYGLAVDRAKVLRKATGLQFDQQSPYLSAFKLDLDDVRLF